MCIFFTFIGFFLPLQIEAIFMLTPFPTTSHSLFFLVYHPPHPIQKPIKHMHYEVFRVLCKVHYSMCNLYKHLLSQPHFGQVWGWSPTLGKVGDSESSGTPECSELDSKGKNTSHWGVLGVVGKVLKRRYRKCPRIDNSDICSPSYGQKKGRESNWQFDSRSLKVGNRCLPDVRFECATWRWKDLDEGYNFGSDLVAIQLRSWELWRFKVSGVPSGRFRDNFGTSLRESREFVPLGCRCGGASQSIL